MCIAYVYMRLIELLGLCILVFKTSTWLQGTRLLNRATTKAGAADGHILYFLEVNIHIVLFLQIRAARFSSDSRLEADCINVIYYSRLK